MHAHVQKSLKNRDEGFTLIELLVVIIIIGILAAIAIPLFLSQRKQALEAAMKSDLKTVANAMESYYADNQTYPAVSLSTGSVLIGTTAVAVSKGNQVAIGNSTSIVGLDAGAFCISIYNDAAGGVANTLHYNSAKGGIRAKGATCTS